jgi:cell fate regulator YaaT (PSP1 superfamily)
MACTSCSTKGCGTSNSNIDNGVKGCKSGGACGCNKMNSYDWLKEMDMPRHHMFDVVEVRFRNGKKEYYRNIHDIELTTGDAIVVEVAGGGYDLGYVSLQGELVRLQMMKRKIKDNAEIKAIWRIASQKDIEKYEQAALRNLPTLFRTRQIIEELNLKMKLSDVDYQADNTKATFYYSAEDRVDFRELIKILASEFKIRVEMRQISLRQEAARLGGIGSCGRELCCSTWLTDFKSVPTSAARYQNLSLNPAKLSGQCGRLKCCLNYELDTYTEALKDIPDIELPLKTQKGTATLTKTDIFKKIMWFAYENETAWHPLSVQRVQEIMELNAKGIIPANLQYNEEEIKQIPKKDFGASILDKVEKVEKEEKRHKKEIRKIRNQIQPIINPKNLPTPDLHKNTIKKEENQTQPNKNIQNNNKNNQTQNNRNDNKKPTPTPTKQPVKEEKKIIQNKEQKIDLPPNLEKNPFKKKKKKKPNSNRGGKDNKPNLE